MKRQSKWTFKFLRVEDWEQNQINGLTLKLLFGATAATAFATLMMYLLSKIGVPQVRPELLFMPWGIALVIGVTIAFHRGVMAERERARDDHHKKK